MKDRELIKAELEKIRHANDGRLTREAVVAAANDEAHPLHEMFEWDDQTAGHNFRLEQAQQLIARYVTVAIKHKTLTISAPFYVRSPDATARKQGHIALVPEELSREQARGIVINELSRCAGSIQRARAIAVVLDKVAPGTSRSLEKMLADLIGLQERLVA